MPEVRFSEPRPFRGQEHIAFHASCSVNGMSTWGYRIECKGCGDSDTGAELSDEAKAFLQLLKQQPANRIVESYP